jgi:hypothetical protein
MEIPKLEPGSRERDINAAIHYLQTVDHDRYVEGGANTEITSVIFARLGKDIRTIKNILRFWVILFCLGVLLYFGLLRVHIP